jgi:hypothetical protein
MIGICAPGARAVRPVFSLLLELLSLRVTVCSSASMRPPTRLLLPEFVMPIKPAVDVRGSRLPLPPAAPTELESPLTRRGIPVGPSRLCGRYMILSRPKAAARRGLDAISIYVCPAKLGLLLCVGV